MDPKAFRLPTDVEPIAYEVRLTCEPGRPRFDGQLTLRVRVTAPTSTLVLHARDLDVTRASASGTAAIISTQTERETVTIAWPEPLGRGEITIDLTFRGKVDPGMSGLYLSKDADEQCICTQCEATDARAIFPCFDEPAFKATLQWTITTSAGNVVLTNGPLVKHEGTTWRFGATRRLPSYLAAVAVGAFASSPELIARDVPLRVWALGGKENLGVHANAFAARLLPWYEDYFGQRYAYGKYDQVAVPSFSFGAMENAGLVVFRAGLLLMDPQTASWRQRKSIALVVAHEFAHMWFGNLVTMKWWDDLWLNESFAEWIAHKVVSELDPALDVWPEFQARASAALSTDALAATHAIYNEVRTPAEATEMFDAITYGKGSAVMRMLEAFLGADAFRDGLRTYMAAHREANATGKDLWTHLAKASDRPVERIMQSWTREPGHPVVHVTSAGRPGELHLRQERFRSRRGAPAGDQTWLVPMVLRYADAQGAHETRHLLEGREGAIRLPLTGALRWCIANADDMGVYRTRLDDALLDAAVRAFPEMSPTERIALVRDQWGLVRNGTVPITQFLGMLDRVASGTDHYAVVDTFVDVARELERILETSGDQKAVEGLRAWVRGKFGPALTQLEPRADEDDAARLRRAAVVRAVASIGRDPKWLPETVKLAERERAQPESVDANLAGLAVHVAAQVGDARRFDAFVREYLARKEAKRPPQVVDRYLNSFASFREPALVTRALALVKDGTVPKQSIGPLIVAMVSEPHAQRLAWEHVKREWPTLKDSVGEAWIGRIVEASGQLPPDLARDMVRFYKANLNGIAQASFARAREIIDERAEMVGRVTPELVGWARGRATPT